MNDHFENPAVATQLLELFKPHFETEDVNDAVYNALVEAITCRVFPGGTRLSSSNLANVFGVSRTPVQIALVRLEHDGLIRSDQTRRYSTYDASFQQGRDINEYMLGMYMFACKLAHARGLDAYYNNLLKLRLERLREETDVYTYVREDNNFHRVIVQSTNNLELLRAFDAITLKSNIMVMKVRKDNTPEDYIQTHHDLNERLLCAIKGSDAALLDQIIVEHNDYCMINVCNWIADP
ncbi:GntR family transcriptional regulator [Eubacteriales bacterium OttesenSCG-928-N14]|nr:GntR family transcriptional regulator [Eubacteriales bacterium OttesenSCG-928-N14]